MSSWHRIHHWIYLQWQYAVSELLTELLMLFWRPRFLLMVASLIVIPQKAPTQGRRATTKRIFIGIDDDEFKGDWQNWLKKAVPSRCTKEFAFCRTDGFGCLLVRIYRQELWRYTTTHLIMLEFWWASGASSLNFGEPLWLVLLPRARAPWFLLYQGYKLFLHVFASASSS